MKSAQPTWKREAVRAALLLPFIAFLATVLVTVPSGWWRPVLTGIVGFAYGRHFKLRKGGEIR